MTDRLNFPLETTTRVTGLEICAGGVASEVHAFTLHDGDRRLLVGIHTDGRLELAEDRMNEAARRFWHFVADIFKNYHQLYEVTAEVTGRASDLAAGLNLREHRPWLDDLADIVKQLKWLYPAGPER